MLVIEETDLFVNQGVGFFYDEEEIIHLLLFLKTAGEVMFSVCVIPPETLL